MVSRMFFVGIGLRTACVSDAHSDGSLALCFLGRIRKEVRQVAGSEFAFAEAPPNTHRSNQHFLTAIGDTLLVSKLAPHGGTEDIEGGGAPVACFQAPRPIRSARCHGARICVGCEGGALFFLHAQKPGRVNLL